MGIKLKYVGESASGKDYVPGIPAADHEVTTKEEAAALVGTGIYEYAKEKREQTVAELTARAEELGVKLPRKPKKAAIIKAIAKAEEAAATEGAEAESGASEGEGTPGAGEES